MSRLPVSGQLREVIASRGLSARELAAAAGVHHSSVTRWLAGERSLDLATFDAIASALALRLVETAKRGRKPKQARA